MGSRETPSSCSKTLETLDLETSDSSSPDADSPLEEQWLKSSPALKEDSVDVVLEDCKEPLSPSSPPTGREMIRYEVKVNRRSIEDICLCCGTLQVYTRHPLFEGGLCAPCKDKFLESLFLCLPFSRSGLLQRRKRWRHQLKAFHDQEGAGPMEIYKTVSAWKRQPVRVLSLFRNIDKVLKSLGFLESGSGSGGGTLKYVEDVTNVVRRDVEKWGPFDLVYGSTQPLGSSCDRCPGWYMFQFHRILQYALPRQESQRPFFWIFMDNLLLTEDDQETTTRFLQTEAVTLQDVRGRDYQNAMRVWSNIPGLKSKHAPLTPKEEEYLQAQVRSRSKLDAPKVDLLVKNCLLPLREYFKYFSQNSLPL